MTDHPAVPARDVCPESWTNTFPQRLSVGFLLIPGLSALFSAFFLSVPLMTFPSDPPSWSLISVNIASALGMGSLGLMALLASPLEGLGKNRVRSAGSSRWTIRTNVVAEPLVNVVFAMLAFGLASLIVWIWNPYSFLPWGPGRRHGLMLLYFAGSMLCVIVLAGMRPWRRRLVFTPHALEYRRFGRPITIPWDTIESLEPEDEGFSKTVTVRVRSPGQPPTLARKRFPDGTAQGKLAIHSMSVDPGTVTYALDRLWTDPESRRLLETPVGVGQLFTGPSWRERIHMKPGQTWSPSSESRSGFRPR